MKALTFLKRWSLLVAICIGMTVYLLFANIRVLQPVGDAVGPLLMDGVPGVLFTLLYVTFCKIDVSEMRPRVWHFIIQLIRASLAGLTVLLISLTHDATTKIVLEGMFVCFICPTAAAVVVVTEKLGGSIGSLTTFTIIANLCTMLIVPFFFPMVERGADITFLSAAAMVFRNVTVVLVVPLAAALLSRKIIPRFVAWLKQFGNLGFYLWCINLAIVTGETTRNICNSTVSGPTMALLLVLPLFVALAQFSIGKWVGHFFGASISAGQALGQKNTVVGIWLTISFLNPLAAVAPGAYVVWQNLINALQLWYKDKYGTLKW